MNRKEKIEKAAYKYAQYGVLGSSANGVWRGFVDGARWADENVSSDMVAEIWNLATKTAIAQFNGEMREFKSEEEIIKYIKQSLSL